MTLECKRSCPSLYREGRCVSLKKAVSSGVYWGLYLAVCTLCGVFYLHADFSKGIVEVAAVIWLCYTAILAVFLLLRRLFGIPLTGFGALTCVYFITALQPCIMACWAFQPNFVLNGHHYSLFLVGALPNLWLFWAGVKRLLPQLRQELRTGGFAGGAEPSVWKYILYLGASALCAIFYDHLTDKAPVEPMNLDSLWLLGVGGCLLLLLARCVFSSPYPPRWVCRAVETLFDRDVGRYPIWSRGISVCLVCLALLHLYLVGYYLFLSPRFYGFGAVGVAEAAVHALFFCWSAHLFRGVSPERDLDAVAA